MPSICSSSTCGVPSERRTQSPPWRVRRRGAPVGLERVDVAGAGRLDQHGGDAAAGGGDRLDGGDRSPACGRRPSADDLARAAVHDVRRAARRRSRTHRGRRPRRRRRTGARPATGRRRRGAGTSCARQRISSPSDASSRAPARAATRPARGSAPDAGDGVQLRQRRAVGVGARVGDEADAPVGQEPRRRREPRARREPLRPAAQRHAVHVHRPRAAGRRCRRRASRAARSRARSARPWARSPTCRGEVSSCAQTASAAAVGAPRERGGAALEARQAARLAAVDAVRPRPGRPRSRGRTGRRPTRRRARSAACGRGAGPT